MLSLTCKVSGYSEGYNSREMLITILKSLLHFKVTEQTANHESVLIVHLVWLQFIYFLIALQSPGYLCGRLFQSNFHLPTQAK